MGSWCSRTIEQFVSPNSCDPVLFSQESQTYEEHRSIIIAKRKRKNRWMADVLERKRTRKSQPPSSIIIENALDIDTEKMGIGHLLEAYEVRLWIQRGEIPKDRLLGMCRHFQLQVSSGLTKSDLREILIDFFYRNPTHDSLTVFQAHYIEENKTCGAHRRTREHARLKQARVDIQWNEAHRRNRQLWNQLNELLPFFHSKSLEIPPALTWDNVNQTVMMRSKTEKQGDSWYPLWIQSDEYQLGPLAIRHAEASYENEREMKFVILIYIDRDFVIQKFPYQESDCHEFHCQTDLHQPLDGNLVIKNISHFSLCLHVPLLVYHLMSLVLNHALFHSTPLPQDLIPLIVGFICDKPWG